MNLLVDDGRHPRALLALEDGTCFSGRSAGAEGEAFGEVVFNTSMVGYQEIVSDPSYAGQIVTFTYPQLGNYGINEIDMFHFAWKEDCELGILFSVCYDYKAMRESCGRGGTGRRAGFRFQWEKFREGSSPFARTIA